MPRKICGEQEKYATEIIVYSQNRNGILFDITKIFTERNIEVDSMNVRTAKNGRATINIGFKVAGKEHLKSLVEKIRMVEGVLDIQRTSS